MRQQHGSWQRKALNTNSMIILEICQYDPFDIIGMTPRGTLGLCCVHIAQLMTYSAIYTLPFTLELCYKPLGILQRLTKSQKIHISSHDGLEKLHNINFAWHRSQSFPEKEQSSRNFSFINQMFWTKNTPLWLTIRIYSNDQKEIVNNLKELDNVHSNATTIHQYL